MTFCLTCDRIARDDVEYRLGGVVLLAVDANLGETRRVFVPSVHIEWHHPGAAMELSACVRMAVAHMKRLDVEGSLTLTRSLGHLRVVLEPWRPG